ncbi:phosphate/phosphite/phosphonate ABC transporter substrate-binding protein [Streptomyces olivochromogenes]|uniref:phosphate/phosphite/phosphonate ABC transporter substrate-binding protein n=1 Tax=Streptomyces olivochromogenes TaxID=1963 RepID=UPI001F43734C|nr:phosphate/phosphite/phosphonate ABC transporter substrate-binding protein [Streptomyces olivochromogenes]MCF3129316.1 phosphate/phosphite/phosphonate ABC transporter substrate-binding protein [Streptomyces olivochromogenes]
MFLVNRRNLGVFALGAASVLTLAGCGESAASKSATSADGKGGDTLVMAAVPAENSTDLQASYGAVIKLLEKETGKKITFQKATNYAAVIEGQRSGKIQIAAYGPFSYVQAKSSGVKTTPVAAGVETKGAKPGYQSYGIVKAGSKVKDLKGFKGKKVCFVDPNSTSGYLYPRAGLLAAGVDVEKGITPVMAGGHDASVLAVKSGQCEAGFAYDTMVDKQLIEKGQLKKGEITTVWKSDMIPGSPVAISDDLDAGLKEKIAKAFQNMANVDYLKSHGFCPGSGKCEVNDAGDWGYAKVDDSDYDGVRKVCDITKDKQCVKS